MNLAAAMICVVALALGAEKPLDKPVTVHVHAIQATNEGRPKGEIHVDPKIASLKDAVSKVPCDTFKPILSEKVEAKPDTETSVKVNERYTIVLTPIAVDDDGRVRIRVRIDETVKKGEETVTRKALESTNLIRDDKPLVLGGLHLDEGQLAVVVEL
ncbi:MAG: hypothetical protein AMXMBFR84_34470 [Candidatus Hydrogenedentota bacterium]